MNKVKQSFRALALAAALMVGNLGFANSETTEPNAKPSGFSSSFRHLCGYSDAVWDYIYEQMGTERPTVNMNISAKQGETGRQFLMFADNSWLITFEYMDEVSADHDVSCIVAHGDRETAADTIFLRVEKLPAETIGEFKPLTEIERILRRPAYRVDI